MYLINYLIILFSLLITSCLYTEGDLNNPSSKNSCRDVSPSDQSIKVIDLESKIDKLSDPNYIFQPKPFVKIGGDTLEINDYFTMDKQCGLGFIETFISNDTLIINYAQIDTTRQIHVNTYCFRGDTLIDRTPTVEVNLKLDICIKSDNFILHLMPHFSGSDKILFPPNHSGNKGFEENWRDASKEVYYLVERE